MSFASTDQNCALKYTFFEEAVDGLREPKLAHEHWELMTPDNLERVFPYLAFDPNEGADFDEDTDWDDEQNSE